MSKIKGQLSHKRSFFLFLLAAGIILTISSCQSTKNSEITDPSQLRGGERGTPLSPVSFTGDTARAYQIARDIPEVLDSLHCYCECKKHMGHKSLLTCYVGEHAAECDICQNEAFMAEELHRQGKDVLAVRKAVDQRFSH